MRVADRLRGIGDPAFWPGRGTHRHIGGPARLEGVMAPTKSSSWDPVPPTPGKDGRWRRLRPPWRHGAWTPEEVALALHTRREELLQELRGLPSARGLPGGVLEEIVDDAACAVVMKPRAVLDEEHLQRAFWLSVKLLLARYREGRHRVRVGSRERADFDAVARQAPATDRTVTEEVEFCLNSVSLSSRGTSASVAVGAAVSVSSAARNTSSVRGPQTARTRDGKSPRVDRLRDPGRGCPACSSRGRRIHRVQQIDLVLSARRDAGKQVLDQSPLGSITTAPRPASKSASTIRPISVDLPTPVGPRTCRCWRASVTARFTCRPFAPTPSGFPELVAEIDDPVGLGPFWEWYQGLSEGVRAQTIGPLLNKLRAFLLRGPVRAIVGQPRTTLDIPRAINEGRLLLARLPKGTLGEDTSRLLGSMVVARV